MVLVFYIPPWYKFFFINFKLKKILSKKKSPYKLSGNSRITKLQQNNETVLKVISKGLKFV